MFGGGVSGSPFSAPGSGFPNTSQQFSTTGMMMGSGIVSPNSSGFGMGLGSAAVGGGSPIFQSPASNKFPAGGGPVVFTPHSYPAAPGNMASAAPVSPYSYAGVGSASSFIQSPPSMMGGGAGVYASPIYSSTMINSPHHHHPQIASPVAHGYGPPVQYSNVQPYGYGTRAMSGGYTYHHQHSPYQQQQHHQNPHHYGHHHSPRDEIVEPMHCSPNAQVQPNVVGGLHYQQLHRNPNSPPRPQYMPAFLTGVDAVAAVAPRPRRMFERSPSTSPPAVGATGSRSPSSKSPSWAQQDGTQPASSGGFTNSADVANAAGGGMYNRRSQGQGPSRQLRFAESQNLQNSQATEEKEKKRNGPPIRGFGSTESEDIANFINSPLLLDNNNMVPGSVIAQEAISKSGANTAKAESNWITVFGFPPAAASFIYTHFSQCGSIIQSKCNPGGNWLHIQYSSRIDARKALANNGKVLGGTIMVGVISSPKEVIEMYGNPQQEAQSNFEPISTVNNAARSQQSTSMKSPLQERNLDASASTSELGKTRSIRPLAGASHVTSPVLGGDRSFILSHENRSALSPSGNENMPLPTASTGILTKAMEYMFGW